MLPRIRESFREFGAGKTVFFVAVNTATFIIYNFFKVKDILYSVYHVIRAPFANSLSKPRHSVLRVNLFLYPKSSSYCLCLYDTLPYALPRRSAGQPRIYPSESCSRKLLHTESQIRSPAVDGGILS